MRVPLTFATLLALAVAPPRRCGGRHGLWTDRAAVPDGRAPGRPRLPDGAGGAPAGILARDRLAASGLTVDGGNYGIVMRRRDGRLTNVTLTNNANHGA